MVTRQARLSRDSRGARVEARAGSFPDGGSRGEAVAAFLDRVRPTQRGGAASTMDRGEIEQQICYLESTMADEDIDWRRLNGTWDVIFTTSRDVQGLMADRPLPFAEANLVGQVYDETGGVENFIVLTAVRDKGWPLISDLFSGTSIRVMVQAEWKITGMRSIGLRFKSASVGRIEFTEDAMLNAVLTNPIFPPRGQWNLNVLELLRELNFSLDFVNGADNGGNVSERRVPASLHIAFLDDDLLIGRAIDTGGLYVYRRRCNTS